MNAQCTRRTIESVLLAFAVIHFGCIQSPAASYQYTVPDRTNDGWESTSLNSADLDTNLIKELFERINDNTYKNIHSVLLVKNGRLVVEEYFPGQNSTGQNEIFKRNTLNEMKSATKSVNSILVGIAI